MFFFRVFRRRVLAACAIACAAAACSRDPAPPPAHAPAAQTPAVQTPAAQQPAAARPPEQSARPKIVVLGDSLSAGFGLAQAQSYPSLIQEKLAAAGYEWEVINAGISGDTSAAGLQRLEWALDQRNVRILVLALGGNDGLRGLPVAEMKKNLAEIIARAQKRHIAVLLAGMEAPPNFGPDYTVSFRQVFRDLAREYNIALVPFLLDKVAGIANLNQGDGIHPNVEGARIVADTIWSALRPMVEAARASAS